MDQISYKGAIAAFVFLIAGGGAMAQTSGSWSDHTKEPTINGTTITIENEGQLAWLAAQVNAEGESDDAGFIGYDVILENDLDLSGYDWVPIGNNEDTVFGFRGTFDGQGHTIRHMSVYSEQGVYAGLFGCLSNPAIIRNLTVAESSVIANLEIGAIAGYYYSDDPYQSTCIINCHVQNTTLSGSEEVGGIVGYLGAGGIADCTCTGVELNSTSKTGDTPGLIVGFLHYATMADCYCLDATVAGPLVGNNEGSTVAISLPDTYAERDVPLATRLGNYDGQQVDVTLAGRTFYKDGNWNTLCLPFDLESFTGTPLAGAGFEIQALERSSLSAGTLSLTFANVTETTAGIPYIVKWKQGQHVQSPTFKGVTLKKAEAGSTETDELTFQGIYEPYSIGEKGDNTLLFLGAGNTLFYPNSAMTIGACRGFFRLADGLTAGSVSSGIRSFTLNFDEDTNAITVVTDEAERRGTAGVWYTLDGRQLQGKPASAGIYVNNGRKVEIK
ncbi:MAG: hypothetical protein IKH58_02260 [Bacteroidales bacterium]|nr:hypothetical protein [Bacteroidales bacterium]